MAQMEARACQWFGVAMTTPSMSLSSSTRRRSCWKPGLKVGTSARALSLARSPNRFSSTSQRVLISTFLSLAKPRFSAFPWPRMPMLATTTRSFAPGTRSLTRGAIPAFSEPKADPPAEQDHLGLGGGEDEDPAHEGDQAGQGVEPHLEGPARFRGALAQQGHRP